MQYYPMFVRVAGWPCLVIGGGPVAERKVATLLSTGATVTVISPRLTPHLSDLTAAGRIVHHARGYRSGDLCGCRVAFAATDDQELQATIARDAEIAGVLLNVADRPDLCSFIAPAVVARGELTIAISTGGASPALAKRVREELDERYGVEYAHVLAILAAVRRRLRTEPRSPAERQAILTALVRSGLLEYVRTRQVDAIDHLLGATIGDGTSMSQLGIRLD